MIDLQKTLATGEIHWDPEDESAFLKFLESVEIDRLRELARLSGLDVISDQAEEGHHWWPVYRAESALPVAWVKGFTGERREGPERPLDDEG